MCKHVLNAQVAIRFPCCLKFYDCVDCHEEGKEGGRATGHAMKRSGACACVPTGCRALWQPATHFSRTYALVARCIDMRTEEMVFQCKSCDACFRKNMLCVRGRCYAWVTGS